MELYNKHRPNNLNEFVGNAPTVRALEAVLNRKKDRIHSFLFTGDSGCGKTTLARITAKMLGCNMDQDFIEMDAAHFRGIDSVRDIRKQMHMAPLSGGKCRVWLLDECHQLSTDAQNALLKALENAPDHVFFVLATTDPKKLLKTVKGRCMEFKVGILSDERLEELINNVVKRENKKVPEKVIGKIIENCFGSARNALVLLDKIIDLDQRVMLRTVEEGVGDQANVIELCRTLMKGRWPAVKNVLQKIEEDPEKVRRAVLGYFTAVLLNNGGNDAHHVIECFKYNFYDMGRSGLVAACYEACK